MKKYTNFTGLYLDDDLNASVNELCNKHRVNKSTAIRIAIEMYIESMIDVNPVVGDTNGDTNG